MTLIYNCSSPFEQEKVIYQEFKSEYLHIIMALSSNSTELELCYKMTFKDGTSKTIDYLEYQIIQQGAKGVEDTALFNHCNYQIKTIRICKRISGDYTKS